MRIDTTRELVVQALTQATEPPDETTEARCAPWFDPWRPGNVRAGWSAHWAANGVLARSADGLLVFLTGRVWADSRCWLHVSYSRTQRIPDYADTQRIRKLFLGEQHWTYAIYPPADQYVNVHPRTLHLWCCLDGPVTPDFSTMVGETRVI